MTVIQQLRAGETTPKTFCGMLVEHSDEMKHIACVITYKDGTSAVFNTTMTDFEKAWMRWCFDQDFRPDKPEDYDANGS